MKQVFFFKVKIPKNKVINGELTYEEAKREVLNHHIEQSKNKIKKG